MVQPRSVAAQIQSPQVIQAKPFLLSIHALKHRMRYPSPDASKVSETESSLLLVLTPIFHANLQASSISILRSNLITFCFVLMAAFVSKHA